MPAALGNVRFRGQPGRHLLSMSSSQFDPGCVKTCASRECAELFSPLSPSTVTASAILFLFNVIETKFLRASSTSEFSHSLDPNRPYRDSVIRKWRAHLVTRTPRL